MYSDFEAFSDFNTYEFLTPLPGSKPNTIPDIKPTIPDIKPTIPDIKPTIPDIKPTIPDIKPTIPDIKPDTIPDIKPDTIPDNKPETKSETKSETKPDTKTVKDNNQYLDNSQKFKKKYRNSIIVFKEKLNYLTPIFTTPLSVNTFVKDDDNFYRNLSLIILIIAIALISYIAIKK